MTTAVFTCNNNLHCILEEYLIVVIGLVLSIIIVLLVTLILNFFKKIKKVLTNN